MSGPGRPLFVLFGSSIIDYSCREGGWGVALAHLYAYKADVIPRGYGGWNSRKAIQMLEEIFPRDAPTQPSLVIICFGGNDAMIPFPMSFHVPLPEFKDNMSRIALYIQSLSETTRCLFLTAPPVSSEQLRDLSPEFEKLRTMENLKKYSEATIQICEELGIKYVDLFNAVQQRPGWETFFQDGVHFNAKGNVVAAEEVFKALKEADWVPSLSWESLPYRFASSRVLLD